MTTTFISAVGDQIGGVVTPLEACMAAGSQDAPAPWGERPDRVVLVHTAHATAAAGRIVEFCRQHGYPQPELHPAAGGDFWAGVERRDAAERFLLNITGGMHHQVAAAVYADRADFFIGSDHDVTKCFAARDNYRGFSLPSPRLKSVAELLAEHPGIVKEARVGGPGPLVSYLRAHDIPLPDGCECDVTLNGVTVDVLWNDGSNRLALLSSLGSARAAGTPQERAAFKARRQHLTHAAAGKTDRVLGRFYDRRWFVLCADDITREHVQLEALRKLTALASSGIS